MKRVLALVLFGLCLSPLAGAQSGLQLEPVASGLASPVYVTHAHDGTNRLFIVEQPGRIKVLQPGTATPTVFLDITTRVLSGGERGLLGLAFHPQYATNRRFFVNYTRQTDGATVVAEYRTNASNPNVADAAETVFLVIAQPFANHNGGMIEFGPDGYLYVGMGDGGSANDPGDRAQNIEDLLGKMLRIDVNTPNGSIPYSSPPDNPFFGATAGRDEIFATGFRNPFRWSFDRATGQLWAGDVGQGVREEIDIVTRGGNYGWRVFEGTRCTGLGPAPCTPANYVMPVAEYDHSAGRCSVTGGYVYRGTRSTVPAGAYVFGDFCTGEIFTFSNGGPIAPLLDTALNISSFGEDEAGEIYVVGLGGTIHRLRNAGPPTFAISGQLTAYGSPLGGVQVSLSGTQAATITTGADGRYSFAGLAAGGGYTVTPSLSGYTFAPASQSFNSLGANQAADFTATTTTDGRINVALASNGATATGSSQYNANFPVEAAINGDRYHLTQADGRYNMWHSAAGAPKPDWLRVDFNGSKTIDAIHVVTQQDDYVNTVGPAEATTFTLYGLTAFEVQYWDGAAWATVPSGAVTGNDRVWRRFTFAPITTSRIRVLIHATADGFSRVWELEAWGTHAAPPPPSNRANFALSANGGIATASSQYNANFPVEAAINGDRFRLYLPDSRYNMWHSALGAQKPDWLQVEFNGSKTIDEIDVVTQQDDYANAVDPTESTTFTQYGLRDFDVQYWDGAAWVTVTGGQVTGNDRVWRKFTFAPVMTMKVRVLIHATADTFSRVWELEAWGNNPTPPPGRINVALSSSGGIATASSQYNANFPTLAAINGDRFRLYLQDGRYNMWHSAQGAQKPDWLQVDFAGPKTITEVDVVTMQDNFTSPIDPTEVTTFQTYGLTDFEVQYWDGAAWVTVPSGAVTGNDRVWRRFTFAPITTSRIRVLVHATRDTFSRIMEVEAWTQ